MKPEGLKKILDDHRKWVYREGGVRADLRGAYLYGADLRGAKLHGADLHDADLHSADLRGAYLHDADLCGAKLYGADLRGADLHDADLRGAKLHGADLHDADLRGAKLHGAYLHDAYLHDADLCGADLHDADLRGADLYSADLRGADLRGADLHSADLSFAKHDATTKWPPFQIPQEGELIVWKSVTNGLAKLRIPPEAKRTASVVGRKCRAEYAEVLEAPEGARSHHDWQIGYIAGQIVRPNFYTDDFTVECAEGIHFFLTREEAENY